MPEIQSIVRLKGKRKFQRTGILVCTETPLGREGEHGVTPQDVCWSPGQLQGQPSLMSLPLRSRAVVPGELWGQIHRAAALAVPGSVPGSAVVTCILYFIHISSIFLFMLQQGALQMCVLPACWNVTFYFQLQDVFQLIKSCDCPIGSLQASFHFMPGFHRSGVILFQKTGKHLWQ